MRLTLLVLEGTPEEFDRSVIARDILEEGVIAMPTPAATDGDQNAVPSDPRLRVPGVPPEGQGGVHRGLMENPAAEEFLEFLAETSGWTNVAVHGRKRKGSRPDAPLDYTSYLRLRRTGSSYGGFAYVEPDTGNVLLRLKASAEVRELAPAAESLAAGHREYRVRIAIRDRDTLRQAIALARRAYEAT